MDSPSAIDNYRRLQEEIAETAISCGRKPEEIQLVAITKNQPWEVIEPIYHEGCRNFGENRLQEALPKIDQAPADCHWHFVGSLQRNKVRKVLSYFTTIHSVDSLELAQKISECAVERNRQINIFLQVNTSGETSKHGMSPEECFRICEKILSLPNLNIRGMMTMAPLVEDEGMIRYTFASLRMLRNKLIEEYRPVNGFKDLSMGMSHDFKEAIREGATVLRIGSRIWQKGVDTYLSIL